MDINNVWELLLEFSWNAREIEQKLGVLESLKVAYAHMKSQKSKESLPIQNSFLTTMASNQVGTIQ